MTLPSILVVVATLAFLVLERLFPGRPLPPSKGWYVRVLLVNGAQLLITLATARLWIELFGVSAVSPIRLEYAAGGGFRGLVHRDVLLLLVARPSTQERLVASIPPDSPFALAD